MVTKKESSRKSGDSGIGKFPRMFEEVAMKRRNKGHGKWMAFLLALFMMVTSVSTAGFAAYASDLPSEAGTQETALPEEGIDVTAGDVQAQTAQAAEPVENLVEEPSESTMSVELTEEKTTAPADETPGEDAGDSDTTENVGGAKFVETAEPVKEADKAAESVGSANDADAESAEKANDEDAADTEEGKGQDGEEADEEAIADLLTRIESAIAELPKAEDIDENTDMEALNKLGEKFNALYEECFTYENEEVTAAQDKLVEAMATLQEMMGLAAEKATERDVFYVNAAANEEDANGSEEHPFTSLADAVKAANASTEENITIILQSDLTATSCARFVGKNVVIQGNGHTITRGVTFDTIPDNARSWYNPAMIEVCDNSHISRTLRLENITLDDAGNMAGTRYSQATTDGKGGNDDTVQDAIIATYDGVGTITLDSRTELRGYGGMSAVRLSGGTLIMESGSKITGGKNFNTRGGGNGPAGAVWIQGGSIIMNPGSEITGVTGRAIYLVEISAAVVVQLV